MGVSDIILLVAGVFYAVSGIASLFTGKVYTMGSSASKYTEDSLKKFARPAGVSNLCAGLGLIGEHTLKGKLFTIGSTDIPTGLVVLAVMAVLSLVIWLCSKKVLVKK